MVIFCNLYEPGFWYLRRIWEDLKTIAQTNSMDRLLGGDFNKVLNAEEKLGGNNISNACVRTLWNLLQKCSLVDLGDQGLQFTWTSKRYKHRT